MQHATLRSSLPFLALFAACTTVVIVPHEAPPSPEPALAASEEAPAVTAPVAVPAPVDTPVAALEPAPNLQRPAATAQAPRPEGKPRVKLSVPTRQATTEALAQALAWLDAHQSADGSWDADGFVLRCGELGEGVCDGAGSTVHDVGVTGLALLALSHSRYHEEAAQAAGLWLLQQQDLDNGRLGSGASHEFLYNHGIATLALLTALGDRQDEALRSRIQGAVDYILRARNPYAAWRYDVPPIGDNDTSITGWMLASLTLAKERGFKIDEAALEGGLSWLDQVTDPATGRVGYDSVGSLSSRTPANEHYPREAGEAMTAVGLSSRLAVESGGRGDGLLSNHARVLQRRLPEWDPEGFGVDMYYWFHGTLGMKRLGAESWDAWRDAVLASAVHGQRRGGDEAGSWDPVGPWGYTGGRVYATALMACVLAECLEE